MTSPNVIFQELDQNDYSYIIIDHEKLYANGDGNSKIIYTPTPQFLVLSGTDFYTVSLDGNVELYYSNDNHYEPSRWFYDHGMLVTYNQRKQDDTNIIAVSYTHLTL